MTKISSISLAVLAAAAAFLAPPAGAAVKWTFVDSNCVGPCGSAERVFAGNPLNGETAGSVSVKAFGATEPGGINNQLAPAALNQFGGGLGVTNGDTAYEGDSTSPEHSMDNKDRFDIMLFDFGPDQVSLTQIEIGWYFNDRDISVLAYEGAGVPDVVGSTYAETEESLRAEGWTLVGNFDVNTDSTPGNTSDKQFKQSLSTTASSSYWLIGAYNPVYGACSGSDVCSFGYDSYGNDKHDYVKLLSLKGELGGNPPPPGVAEPASLLLLAAGGIPALWRRRRRHLPASA